MKRIILFVVLCFLYAVTTTAQIHSVEIVPKSDNASQKAKPESFQGKDNYLYNNEELYKGQELYVLPFSVEKSNNVYLYGYEGFKTIKFNPRKDKSTAKRYGNAAAGNKNNTDYKDLEGKVFVVDDVNIIHKKTKNEGYSTRDTILFLMHEKENPANQCIYNYTYSWSFPFVVMKHFEWLKEKLVGKVFHFDPDYVVAVNKDYEISRYGTTFVKKEWKCIDIITSPSQGCICLLLEDEKGNKVYSKDIRQFGSCSGDQYDIPTGIAGGLSIYRLGSIGKAFAINKTKWDGLQEDVAVGILKHQPVVGMTTDEVQSALGYQERIHSSADGISQYIFKVYSTTYYVYIQGGKVIDWQK